jgi:hypothetical protein
MCRHVGIVYLIKIPQSWTPAAHPEDAAPVPYLDPSLDEHDLRDTLRPAGSGAIINMRTDSCVPHRFRTSVHRWMNMTWGMHSAPPGPVLSLT